MSFQKEEWKLHQFECQAMVTLTEDRRKVLTPTIRLMVRLVLKRKLQNEEVMRLQQAAILPVCM
jgi:[histone H3]-lysine4/36 N-trimethyltransferase SMYD